MPAATITCCPSCKRAVEAKDYMDRFVLGMLDSVLPQISCRCGYHGLPISVKRKDYEKWLRS